MDMTDRNVNSSADDTERVIYEFTIDGAYFGRHTFPSLNDYLDACRKGPQVGARMKRQYQMIASNAIRRYLKRARVKKAVFVRYRFYEPDRRRDPSNIASMAVKVIEDALQVCGVLPNDNAYWIKGYSQEFFYGGAPKIEVEMEEVE